MMTAILLVMFLALACLGVVLSSCVASGRVHDWDAAQREERAP